MAIRNLFILYLLVVVYSKLDIYLPEKAAKQCRQKLNNQQIRHTIATFGYIPYGFTQVSQLIFPPGDWRFCQLPKNFTPLQKNKKKAMLIKRGDCMFTKKVLNAQKYGANLAIIYDNYSSPYPHIIMKNDGHGNLVDIPSVFIGGNQGQVLVNITRESKQSIWIRVSFEVNKTDKVDLTLWLDPSHRQSYIFIRDYYNNKYYQATKNSINLQLNFLIHQTCFSCPINNDCLRNQKHCFMVDHLDESKQNPHTGKKYIYQQMRSYFLLQSLPSNQTQKWWKYMIQFDFQDCFDKKDVQQCSFNIMKKLNVTEQQIQSVKKLIKDTQTNVTNSKNENIFDNWIHNTRQSSIHLYPEASVNSITYYGLFRANNIFQMVCQSLSQMPQACDKMIYDDLDEKQYDHTLEGWKIALIIILVLSVIFAISLIVYTKIIRKQVNQQMSIQVNRLVQNYSSLSQHKSVEQKL